MQMKIGVLKETHPHENRCSIIPSDVVRYVKLGFEVLVEQGIGASIGYADEDYVKAGAEVCTERDVVFAEGGIILALRPISIADAQKVKAGSLLVSYLDPANNQDLLRTLADRGATAVSMEFIPRTTRAQKMDALSSQASLAGYAAVLLAASETDHVLPMMTTPAGTINAGRVFIIGAGVAGLQAIATAKRLGARVDAFDTRPVVAEQVKSLGARFVEVDLGETGQTKDGYAKALTEEQLAKQREVMAKQCAMSDIVITTAQVFGRKAPIIITKEMVQGMKPGSIIIDLAVETGGNTEGAEAGKVVDVNGVRIFGHYNMPGKVAYHASQMYSANLFNFVDEFWDKETKILKLSLDDDILAGCVKAHEGKVL
jgi:H+-translocating NAD(P) transhydrogenase subunit alpha